MFGENMSNTSVLIVGIVAAALLCGSAVAVIAIVSTNDDGMSYEQREFYAGYAAGFEQGSSERNLFTTDCLTLYKIPDEDDMEFGDECDEFCCEAIEVNSLALKKTVRSDAWLAGYDYGYFDGREGNSYSVAEDYEYYCNRDMLRTQLYADKAPAAQAACAEA